jgi:catechol 2,3-dioxygenase-like lactoylglutathione lyase family enzyme
MLTRIHHVGVVVPSLEEGLRFWRDTLGMRLTKSATIEEQGVRAALLEVGGSEVELLEPLGPRAAWASSSRGGEADCITYASKPTTSRASSPMRKPRASS